jgi:membrane-bound lytic murein transglycosylase MltF
LFGSIALNRSRLYFVSPVILFLLAGVLSYISSVNNAEIKVKVVQSQPKNTEGEQVVSPSAVTPKKVSPLSTLLNYKSYQSNYYLENIFKNWPDLLELFASNYSYKQNVKSIHTSGLESLTQKVSNVEREFSLGSVDRLVEQYGEIIKRECNYYKLDWRLVLAMVRQESFFNPNAVSHAGAFGLMQIMPRTGAGLQQQLSLQDTKTPENNLIAGIYYYATLVASFEFAGEEKYKFALAAYNGGLGRVIDAMTIAAYMEKDYNQWDNVKEMYPYLASNQDSIHALVWPKSQSPPYGALNNWKEPYNYVTSIMFYYNEYKKYFPGNLKEEKPVKKKKKKSK